LRYRFPDDQEAGQLVANLRCNRWWGQIVGPHGSGKSTLLATLVPELERAGRNVVLVRLHSWQRTAGTGPITGNQWSVATQVVVDGYEQLGRLRRFRLRSAVRRAGAGLLATAHAPVGLPDLAQTRTDVQTVLRIVGDLVASQPVTIGRSDVVARFHARQGNVREILFDLYDLHERRRG
jgi:ABC-type cobalamin/Fe3+-siderophores transport system ATPase subunit